MVERVLSRYPALDGPTPHSDIRLLVWQGLAGGHPDLVGYQVHARHHLGHRVLHLEAGVHLQEVNASLLIDKEFDGSDVRVVHGPGCPYRHLPEPLA